MLSPWGKAILYELTYRPIKEIKKRNKERALGIDRCSVLPRVSWTLSGVSIKRQPDVQPASSDIGMGDLPTKGPTPNTTEDPLRPRSLFSHRRAWESLWVHAQREFHDFLSAQIPGYLFLLCNFQRIRYMTQLLFCWSTGRPYRQTLTLGENNPRTDIWLQRNLTIPGRKRVKSQ